MNCGHRPEAAEDDHLSIRRMKSRRSSEHIVPIKSLDKGSGKKSSQPVENKGCKRYNKAETKRKEGTWLTSDVKDTYELAPDSTTAVLSSNGEYSLFVFRDRRISFYTGKNLDRYTRIVEWDHGYLVVMCRTISQPDQEVEDYIDLLPILDNLYIDADQFLDPIEEVEIKYA